jgi:hypothetical protein
VLDFNLSAYPRFRLRVARLQHGLTCGRASGASLVDVEKLRSRKNDDDPPMSLNRLVCRTHHSRSAFVERVLQDYLRGRERAEVEARDLELINGTADRLNLEAESVLDYRRFCLLAIF